MVKVVIFWFRRDLRVFDNRGLFEALTGRFPVLPVFIFDPGILNNLEAKDDARVTFIYREVEKLKRELERRGSSLRVFHDTPLQAFRTLISEYDVFEVYANRDYDPYARDRDREIDLYLKSRGVKMHLFKDHLVFEGEEILKPDGTPYTVFTPYSKKWKETFHPMAVESYPSKSNLDHTLKITPCSLPAIEQIGFKESSLRVASPVIDSEVIKNYAKTREIPAIDGTTRLGVHLRFGTVSIRELSRLAMEWSESYLNELIWRNFFSVVLWHFPRVENEAFKPKYNRLEWRNNEREFDLWCRGETGFSMVDAGMRELNSTGFMHNRVRMITASFLTKLLLVDWRWGEAWFAAKLLDYELASNNGNWQWAAGTGCDAAPYFRIFNPDNQEKKFDPQGLYVNKWVPERGTSNYAQPVVDYGMARQRALDHYRKVMKY